MLPVIREAVAADHKAIRELVLAANLNPVGLDWRRFQVADAEGQVVGIGQLKLHKDGTLELASIAVLPEWRKQGIGRALVGALLAGGRAPVYLFCLEHLMDFYVPFGFRAIPARALPRPIRSHYYRIDLINTIGFAFRGRKPRLIAMLRPATSP